MRPLSWSLSSLIFALGCGGHGGSPSDGGPDSTGSGGVDYSGGTWKIEQVSQTPTTISHAANLVLLADGTPQAAWVEADPSDSFDEDIFTSIKSGAGWSAGDARTNDTGVQNSYPRLGVFGDVTHLVWGGYPGGDNDLFYARYENGTWTARTDLTTPFETTAVLRRDDRIPAFAVGPSGELAISYSSSLTDSNGNPMGPFEIRVLRLDATGAAMGSPTTVIPAGTSGCDSSSIVFDASGKLHVAADCGPLGGEDLYYATDETGTWTNTVVPGGNGRDDYGAQLALEPDGTTVDLVWMAFPPCASTPSMTCSDVMYRRIHQSSSFDPEVNATATGDESELNPTIGVDPGGRPLIAFHRANAGNFFDVYMTWSEDRQTFAPARNLTPGTDGRDDDDVASIVFHPTTALPHLIFSSTLTTSPLNTEAMHGELVP